MADEKNDDFDPTNIRHIRQMMISLDAEDIDADILRRAFVRVCEHAIKLEAGVRELAKRIVTLEKSGKQESKSPTPGAASPSSSPAPAAPAAPGPTGDAAIIAQQAAMVPEEVKKAWASQGIAPAAPTPPPPAAAQPSEPV